MSARTASVTNGAPVQSTAELKGAVAAWLRAEWPYAAEAARALGEPRQVVQRWITEESAPSPVKLAILLLRHPSLRERVWGAA